TSNRERSNVCHDTFIGRSPAWTPERPAGSGVGRRRSGVLGGMVSDGSAAPAIGGLGRHSGAAELLVRLDRTVQRITETCLRVAIGGPVPTGHRSLGIRDRGVHI